ncbi:MAG: hypothetical protein V4699_00070 [Patescibacteria group bacterium]
MGIFSRHKEKGKLALVFYVGSSSVEGALFLTEESGIPKIIFSIRELIALEDNVEASRFFSLTLKSLESVTSQIHRAGLGAPDEIYCVLSSLWYVSQTRTIRLEKNTPFIFTSKMSDELIKKEVSLFEEEQEKKYASTGAKVRVVELKNIKTVINGYETSHPLNQKGQELEMTVFISISSEPILAKIEETIKAHFNAKEIKFSSFALSSFAVVRDLYAHQNDFLLISVGGEVTDISMVKKNVLRESISFPLGTNFLVRGVASVSHASLPEAKSSISLFKDGHASEALTKSLGPTVDKLKKEWLTKFQDSLSNLSNDISVPSTIYLSIDRELADFFSETIKTEQFNQYTLTESKFKVVFLGSEVFHGLIQFEGNTTGDTFLIVNAIYINRFLINPKI